MRVRGWPGWAEIFFAEQGRDTPDKTLAPDQTVFA